ncbi:MAG: glycosyltransferase family 2 protein [Phycisphaerae bacterium]|nr:glycosyltransferase family 2 protein [Phycisphaerae bacterium]
MGDPALDPAHQLPTIRVGAAIPIETQTPPSTRSPTSTYTHAIAIVIPCFNRQSDLDALLGDLAAIDTRGLSISVTIVDNASTPPLHDRHAAELRPPGFRVEWERRDRNLGGAGGFNAGLARILSAHDPDLLWLIDSDARVGPSTLPALLEALRADPTLVAAGSAIADPRTGRVFELGGRIDRRTGYMGPAHRGAVGAPPVVICDYAAACSLMVRAPAVRRAGLMRPIFLNADDAEWCLRLAHATGGRVGACRDSVVRHPRFDRFAGGARYYTTRNSVVPLGALGLGWRVRARRALGDAARAVGLFLIGRPDLARLHARGLADAAASRWPADPGVQPAPEIPWDQLPARLAEHGVTRGEFHVPCPRAFAEDDLDRIRAALVAAGLRPASPVPRGGIARLLSRRRPAIAVCGGREGRAALAAGRLLLWTSPGARGVVIGARAGPAAWFHAARAALRGAWDCLRIAVAPPEAPLPPAAPPVPHSTAGARPACTVGVVVLSYNRLAALERTLEKLRRMPRLGPAAGGRIVVVDNASTDGTPDRIAASFPDVDRLALPENTGVRAFNLGVDRLDTDLVLILDDDACPDEAALTAAADLLREREDLAAVALHPRHPATRRSEWAFTETRGLGPDDRWPFMGCGNLVRRDAWHAVRGYEESFFLYRNDTDLALKLLASGRGVHFNPEWVVWHDSPQAARKSRRWFELATRNWIWMCRRHGRGAPALRAALLGWAWAHRLAGASLPSHVRAFKGGLMGWLASPANPAAGHARGDGSALRRMMKLKLGA